jgi:signal transduction histidine kinase
MPNRPSTRSGNNPTGSIPHAASSLRARSSVLDQDLAAEIEPADVLVVDDEPANLQAVDAALEGLDIRIIAVTSGQEALRSLLHRNVALILLDVRMPIFSGFEIARLIRLRARTRHVPIIFLTAHNQNAEDIRRGYELGAVDYLFKPFAPDVLRAKVQAFVELRNRTAEVRAQARLLGQLEREAGERRLLEAKREWEADALRHQMEEQRKLTTQLEDADRRKDEFLAVLAHELRNPLAPLVAGLEFIRLQSTAAPVERVCDAMNRQVHHLVRLVDDLLDLSRISRGKVELQRVPIDIRGCIAQAVETTIPAINKAGHRITVDIGEEPLVCDADRVRVTQIVNNLLGNAARYTDPGGEIHVEAGIQGGEIAIVVRDNGKGIPEHLLEAIFETFVQEQIGDAGLGLGLTLVKQVVTMHGGSVVARSEGKGKGAEFEVRLPRVPTESIAPHGELQVAVAQDGTRLRVLIVEDQLDVGATTRALLEAWGHQVHVAHDGREGIALATSLRPDVVLLDIGLPDMDGYGVAETIRNELGAARPRLVAVTGFGQARDRARAQEAGFDAHIVKPAQPDTLRDTLSRVTVMPSS